MFNIIGTLRKYRRVMQVARKPSKEEYTGASKITALGLVVIGLIGFVIFLIFVMFPS
jgi:protein transport protein SEC61 subunit gamma-like protein